MPSDNNSPSSSDSAPHEETAAVERPLSREDGTRSITEMQLELLVEELDEMRAEIARLQSQLNEKSQPTELISNTPSRSSASFSLRGLIVSLRGCFLSRETKRRIKILALSPHFDPGWYAETYSDVSYSVMTPEEHFIRLGALEGRDPSPDFSVARFYSEHPDARSAGYDPITFIFDKNIT